MEGAYRALCLEANRNGYELDQLSCTTTVKDLIEFLEGLDEDLPVVFSNDNGYTYGDLRLNEAYIRRKWEDEDGEEQYENDYTW